MNFGYKKTVEKRTQLTSLKRKFSTKLLVKSFKVCIYLLLIVFVVGGFFVIGMAKGIIDNAPDVNNISINPTGHSTTIYDNEGNETAVLVSAGSNRTSVTIDKIPEYLKWAFVCIEDARFYEHQGIDIKGIVRAAYVAVTTRDFSEGASTITQQVLKNNVFTGWESKQTLGSLFKRKIQEQYLAIQLEKVTTKENILLQYMNTINLGANTLGVQAASQRYFNKNVEDLTLSESAVIAAITQNPYQYNPINFPEENALRREKILTNMLAQGKITEKQFNKAIKDDVYSRIQKVDSLVAETSPYSYFVDELIDQVLTDLMEYKGYTYNQAYNALYSGGLNIYTTQDASIQKICDKELQDDANFEPSIQWSVNWAWSVQRADGTVENFSESSISKYHKTVLGESAFKLLFWDKESAKECVEEYKKAMKKKGDVELGVESLSYSVQPQASFTVMDQSTGEVKAIVGGRGKKEASLTLNRATDTTRQPGSTFKPLAVYSPALDTKGYTLSTKVVDSAYNYSNGKPVNNWYSGYKGTVTVKSAIANSINIVAVKVITDITPELAYDYLLDYGFTTLVVNRKLADGTTVGDINQPLALGGITDGVSNIELCAAYATIANGGVYTKPIYYTKIVDNNGKVLIDNTTPTTHTVIKPTTAYYLTQALEDVVNGNGTGTAAAIKNMHVAGKTGTTSNEYDLWFAGFTPYLTGVIWTGYDENTSLGNGVWHNKLWSKIMTQIHELKGYSDSEFMAPNSFIGVDICEKSGKVAVSGACPSIIKKYFAEDAVPTVECTDHTKETSSKVEETSGNAVDNTEATTANTSDD